MNGAYWEAKLGRHASDDYYFDEYRQFWRSMPIIRCRSSTDGSNNIYPKGALVLRMLRRRLGDERFWASIHLFLTRHKFGSAVTEDVREAVLDATGENLAQFWAEWMYRPGYPHFAVRAAYDSATRRLLLHVKQTQGDSAQSDNLRADTAWPPTPSVYHAPVTVLVGTSRGAVRRRTMLDAREQTIVIDSLPDAPTMVVFDEGNTIVKALDFPQPTAWLATELANDPDLWDRWWAIGELGHRADDDAALRALANAATGADYFLTRKHASMALARFSSAVAYAALDSARRDSSAQVRESAITSLGYIGGAQAFPALRTALGDASYGVQAAALTALIRADTARRKEWIARGLSTKSYRDVIQSSTLNTVARLGDGTYTATVDSLRGENALAANTLAVLAVRGDSAALSALVRALDDSRPYVRDWTLRALRRMPADLRDPPLRAALGSLRDAKTRSAVDALLNPKPPAGTR